MAGSGRRTGRVIIIFAILLIFILILAAVAYVFLSGMLSPQPQTVELFTPTPAQNLQQIVITAQNIKRGTIISEAMLGVILLPKSEMVENLFFTDMAPVLGKIAKYDLQQGTPITPALISDKPLGSLIASQIPPGKVAISIPIDAMTSVSYVLQPGDHVNIIAAFSLVDLDANFQTILPNITSSVVGQTVTKAQCGAGGECYDVGQDLVVKILPSIAGDKEGLPLGRAENEPTLGQPVYVLPSEPQRPRTVSQMLVQDAVVIWIGDYPFGKKPEEVLQTTGQGVSVSTEPTEEPAPQVQGAAPAPTAAPPPMPDKISVAVSQQEANALTYLISVGAKLTLTLRSAGDENMLSTDAVTLQYLMDQYNIPYPAKLPYGIEKQEVILPTPTVIPQ